MSAAFRVDWSTRRSPHDTWSALSLVPMLRRLALAIALSGMATAVLARDDAQEYALVVGIDKYQFGDLRRLDYAVKDAVAVEAFLKTQGYKVTTLLNEKATKTNIISVMQNDFARRVRQGDRVLVFFAGHGYTERLGGRDWGYIVPHDGGADSASYISMEELAAQSAKMGNATHQLFVMDSCYGGLLAVRATGVKPTSPKYLEEIMALPARQIITAGGADQLVQDGGPNGQSLFTGYLLEALREGLADVNGDGYITFSELANYLLPRASTVYQTPGVGILPNHGNGEFVFRARTVLEQRSGNPREAVATPRAPVSNSNVAPPDTRLLVWHRHEGNSFGCSGSLTLLDDRVRFEGSGTERFNHRFDIPLSEIKDLSVYNESALGAFVMLRLKQSKAVRFSWKPELVEHINRALAKR